MSHIFISYSRKDIDFASKIVQVLAENNLETWIDWKSIPKGENWELEIYRGIEEADALLFLISTESVQSEMCNKEIAHAVKNGKRILPIVIRDMDAKIIHAEISKRNWIFCRDRKDDFDKAIEEIHKTIQTDYEWLKFHTNLQVKALDWQRRKDDSRLLRGTELREVEQRFSLLGTQVEPQPTGVQRRYIFSSRAHEDRIQSRTRLLLVSGIVVAFSLACTATFFGVLARRNARIQLAKTVSAVAANFLEEDPQRATLLALASQSIAETNEAQDVISRVPFAFPQSTITIAEYTSRINSVSWNPDGSLVAIGADEGSIVIWDVAANKQSKKFTVEAGGINSTSWSPDGSRLVTGGQQIILWDVATGEILDRLASDPPGTVDWAAEWSPAQDMIIIYTITFIETSSPTIWLWDLEEGTISELNNHLSQYDGAPCVSWSPDGTKLASSSHDGYIFLWEVGSDSPIKTFTLTDVVGTGRYCVAWSSDGSKLGVTAETSIVIMDAETGAVLKKLTGFESGGYYIAWHPTKNILASAGFDEKVLVWDVDTAKQTMSLNEPTKSVESISWSPDGTRLAAGSSDSLVTVWNFTSTENSVQYGGHPGGAWSASWASDSSLVASGGADEKITIWDTATHQPITTLFGQDSIVATVSWSPDNRQLASGGPNGKFIIWDLATKQRLAEINQSWPVLRVDWSPNKKFVLVQGRGTMMIWDVTDNEPTEIDAEYPRGVWGVAWHPNGTQLALGQSEGVITIWDVINQTIKKQIAIEGIVSSNGSDVDNVVDDVAWSPDGSRLAVRGRSDNKIVVWNTRNWEIILEFRVQSVNELSRSLAWSPDGKKLAATKRDGLIVWDIESNERLATFTGEIGKINDIAWSPDNSYIAIATTSQGVVVMSTKYVGPPCSWVSRNLTQEEWDTYVSLDTPYKVLCPDQPVPNRIK